MKEPIANRTIDLRWPIVISYIVIVNMMAFLPIILDIEGNWQTPTYLAVVFGGLIVVFGAIMYPYFKKGKRTVIPEGVLLEDLDNEPEAPKGPFSRSVRFDIVIYTMVPIIVIFLFLVVMFSQPPLQLTFLLVVALLLIVWMVFGSLEIHCDREELSFHYGPIGKKIPIDDIMSVRSVAVQPLKEFLGWGIRIGHDGTIGYIASGKVGVRLEVKDNKSYVITLNDPQSLVDHIRGIRRSRKRVGSND